MLVIALTVMVCAVLAQHLGLSEAIAEVIGKVAKCPMCLTFWSVAATLWLHGEGIIVTVALSILAAYLSNYVGLILLMLQEVYLWLRKRFEK